MADSRHRGHRPGLSAGARTGIVVGAALVVIAVLIGTIVVLAPHSNPDAVTTPSPPSTPSATPIPTPTATPTPSFDKTQFSIDDPSSLWVVVDKLRPLNPKDYAAPDLVDVPVAHVYAPKLRQEAASQVVQLFGAFTQETGLKMQSQSAYRSYSTQVSTYNGWVSSLGQAGADRQSARPGYSEHQTGLAIDISASPNTCALQECFADTPQGTWLAANAYRYGFILRYPRGMEAITGYKFEPWHYRYVGVALATEMHVTGAATLEDFFGLPPAPNYAG